MDLIYYVKVFLLPMKSIILHNIKIFSDNYLLGMMGFEPESELPVELIVSLVVLRGSENVQQVCYGSKQPGKIINNGMFGKAQTRKVELTNKIMFFEFFNQNKS